jgi:tetratricopeptide (TPR) repeat protein
MYAKILEYIGNAYHLLENYENAEKNFIESYQVEKNNIILLKIVQSIMKQKNFSKAISYLNLYITEYWSDINTIYSLWLCYYAIGEYSICQRYINIILSKFPDNIQTIILKIKCIFYTEWKIIAIKYLNNVLKKFPQNKELEELKKRHNQFLNELEYNHQIDKVTLVIKTNLFFVIFKMKFSRRHTLAILFFLWLFIIFFVWRKFDPETSQRNLIITPNWVNHFRKWLDVSGWTKISIQNFLWKIWRNLYQSTRTSYSQKTYRRHCSQKHRQKNI